MKNIGLTILLGVAFLAAPLALADNDYSNVYTIYIEAGQRALQQDNLERAMIYFEAAHTLFPQEAEALSYINLIKRMSEGQVTGNVSPQWINTSKKHIYGSYPLGEKSVSTDPVGIAEVDLPDESDDAQTLSDPQPQTPEDEAPSDTSTLERPSYDSLISDSLDEHEERQIYASVVSSAIPVISSDASTMEIRLNEELWNRQPDTVVEIPLGAVAQLVGQNIERFLLITPGVVGVERVSKDELQLTALKRGSTFIHIWDGTGRWTFHVQVILPYRQSPRGNKDNLDPLLEEFDPFRFTYSGTWSSFYTGTDADTLDRTNLIFRQWMGLEGPTPYGNLYGSVNFYKFAESTELTSYSAGLTDAHIGPFEKFSLRLFDTNKRFSDLSLAGRYFRGFVLDAMAFHEQLAYSLIYGQDRSVINYLTPGTQDLIESYIEGVRVTWLPLEERNYSFNYVRGYGEARPDALPEDVISVETNQTLGDWKIRAEAAHDGETSAQLIQSHRMSDDDSWQVNFRNIEKDFSTISGRPAAQGEVGGNVRWSYRDERFRLYSNLDAFQDRQQPNPDDNNDVNVQWNGHVDVPLSNTSNINVSAYADYEPQVFAPRQNMRVQSRYSKDIKVWLERRLSYYFGAGWQENLYDNSPDDDFRRSNVNAGVRLGLIEYLSGYTNYEYSRLEDRETNNLSYPRVLNAGLNYSRPLTDKLSGSLDLSYRDEEDTEETFSFLAGEDSIRGSIGLAYHPDNQTDIFIDSSLRKIWSEEQHDLQSYEGDIRLGVRKTWDLPLHWSPSAVVEGRVYRDPDSVADVGGNLGVSGVSVRIGRTTVSTDETGAYRLYVSAKKVRVSLDVATLPKGFILTTPMVQDVEIKQGKAQQVDFMLTSRSGVYGVVFVDSNQNGQADAGEQLISKVRLRLDGVTAAETNRAGAYFFENIRPGDHELRVDINSIPLSYIPTLPMINTVHVEEGQTAVFHIPLKLK